MICNNISLHINYLNKFEKINNNLNQYDFIIIDKYNEHEFKKIRKNIDEIYIPNNIDSKTEIYSTNRFMYVQSTLQSSGVSLKFKPRISNIYLHGKQNIVMGDVKHEMVNDLLTRSCNDGDMRIWT